MQRKIIFLLGILTVILSYQATTAKYSTKQMWLNDEHDEDDEITQEELSKIKETKKSTLTYTARKTG